MLDILISGGTVVDGTGRPPRQCDVGVRDGLIVEIDKRITTPARQRIEAAGAIVTPGFVDVHTHYDGQVLWDDKLDPSFSNGVTTMVAGNCGVGFAPARPEFRTALIEMMDGVEDIPGIVLDTGLDWQWRSFCDYLERIAARRYTMDVAFQIAHAPLRVFVMGERALKHELATPEDIVEMARLVREAVEQGAVGFSASRIIEHRTSKGAYVPGTFSAEEELTTIARAMGETGKGVVQMIPLGTPGNLAGTGSTREERITEHGRIVRLAKAAGRPLTYLLMRPDDSPEDWHIMVRASEQAICNEGVQLFPQVHGRGIGLLATLDGYHALQCRPSYMDIAHLPKAQRAAAMREPVRRAAILSEQNVPVEQAPSRRIHALAERYGKMLQHYYLMSLPLDYEPGPDKRLDVVAAQTGQSMEAVYYDHLAAGDGSQFAAYFAQNYGSGDLDETREMLSNPIVRLGLADGGAHLQLSCDGALPTFQLVHWARDRKRGPTLPLEHVVRQLTADNAALYSMNDRGTLALGKRADINVIDFDNLSLDLPNMLFDLPKGGKRLLQYSKGYAATLVKGVITRRDDQDTGARPGRLYRSARA
jgi:N-acyl-D-amino-acid deacylase